MLVTVTAHSPLKLVAFELLGFFYSFVYFLQNNYTAMSSVS